MPDIIKLKQTRKTQPPEIALAVEVLARVQKDAPEIAQAWRKVLPALALHMAKAGQPPEADNLERIVRENRDAAKIKTLFHAAATEIAKPARLTYESVVAKLPETGTQENRPETEWTLSDAARLGRLDKVKELITVEADVNSDEGDALDLAAAAGHLKIVKYLLENLKHSNYNAVLGTAAENGHIEIVKYLLTKDGEQADIHANRDEPLCAAAYYGYLDIVKYLLEKNGKKADIHALDDWPLHMASKYGHLDIVKYLLEKKGEKADIHAGNDKALRYAVENGHLDIVKYLLEKDGEKANINTYAAADSALVVSALHGYLGIARYLCEKDGEKADIHAGRGSALRLALMYSHFDVAHYLLTQGANGNVLSDEEERCVTAAATAIAHWRKIARQDPPEDLWDRDPEGVNLVVLSACADILRGEGYDAREANKYAYQTVRLFGDEQQALKYLERWGSAGKQPLHDVVQMIDCPQRKELGDPLPVWDRKTWADAVMAQGPKMAKLVKFASRVNEEGKPFVPVRARTNNGGDGVVSLALTIQAASQFAYGNSKANPEFAALCFTHLLDEDDFEKGLKIINKTPKNLVKNIPDIAIAGEEFGMQGARFRRLAPLDPKGLLLGEYTDCCQHIGGAGAECAQHGYQSPDGGFYVVENAKGEIVGQTWAWRGTKGELVLDSLETLGKHVSDEAWKKIITAFSGKLAENPENNVTSLHIGTDGGTPNDMGLDAAAHPAQPKSYSGYRDSHNQFRVASFAPSRDIKPARKSVWPKFAGARV